MLRGLLVFMSLLLSRYINNGSEEKQWENTRLLQCDAQLRVLDWVTTMNSEVVVVYYCVTEGVDQTKPY